MIKQAEDGPEWHSLVEEMSQRDQTSLKNNRSFNHLNMFFLGYTSDIQPDTPITMLNECLIADFGDGPICLHRADLSNHARLHVLSDLQTFLPAWLATQKPSHDN